MSSVVISGASGLVGTALMARLRSLGHTVTQLVRSTSPAKNASAWDPYKGQIDQNVIEACDSVVNLSGASIAGGPWTSSRRKTLRDSRVMTSRLLAETIARCERGPQSYVQASAIGYYGDRPNEVLTETSPVGTGFLADLCVDWEDAAGAAREAGTRVVFMRTGLVLAKEGGFLEKLLLPFKLGLGARLGSGDQFMSWLTLDDMVEMYRFVIEHDQLAGPVNCVAPNPVTNATFTKQLAAALNRPAFLAAPALPLRLVMRDMADELLFASQNVSPGVLDSHGYQFKDPELEAALKSVLAN